MATTEGDAITPGGPADAPVDKGLKSNALSLVSNVVIGVASTAPAYSLAATLGLIAVAVGVLSPTIVVLAFIPMLFVSIGYSELNKADPDCGTTFTWGTRTFGPWIGWLGGWGIVVSDVLDHGRHLHRPPAPNRLWVADFERHEALLHREEVRDLLLQPVAAG